MKPTPQGSIDALVQLARLVPRDEAIVELGVHRGGTAIPMAAATEARVYAIDLWDMRLPDGELDTHRLKRGFSQAKHFAAFREAAQAAGVERSLTFIKGDSSEIAKAWTRPIGLLHIDAAHDAASVRRDFEAWAPWVVPGGYLAMDDAQPDRAVATVIRSVVLPSGQWEELELVGDRLFLARRRPQ